MLPELPASVVSLVAGASALAFSGARSASPSLLAVLAPVCAAVSPSASVAVGCASGVDGAVRAAFPRAVVFSVAAFRASSFAARLALRSAACVRSVAGASAPLVVVLPSGACPAGLAPSPVVSAAFGGFGSGSWSSAALAAGCGLPLLVFAPFGAPAWGFAPLGGGWFFLAPSPSLF